MILTIDSGNTNVVFGLFDPASQEIVKAFRTANDPERTADEYIVWLASLLQINGYGLDDIQGTIIASVVAQVEFNLISLCRRYFHCEPLVVGSPNFNVGVKIAIENPEQVGADRLVNAYVVNQLYRQDAICIDFGTATTFDVVSADGSYLGGVIAPGIRLSLLSLINATDKLPMVEITPPPRYIGRNTREAMQSGIFFGYVAMVEGMVAKITAEYGKPMKIIATGGLCELLAAHTNVIEVTNKSLTLQGLGLLWLFNQPKL